MNAIKQELLLAIELHAPERLRAALARIDDPRALLAGKSLVSWLTEMYTRSDRFCDCLRLLLERGARLEDPLLKAVLLDDAETLRRIVGANPALLAHRCNLVCAFTPLIGASLLHVAAEYGLAQAARALLELGAEVDAPAAFDEYGLNGHSPLFHTVNSNDNRNAPIMELLLDAGASSSIRVDGIHWGAGFDWETICLDVSPISYAQLGLLPQMHRNESQIHANIRRLASAAGRRLPAFDNVPNRYLKPGGSG